MYTNVIVIYLLSFIPMQRGKVIKTLVFNINGERDPEVFINMLFVSTEEFKP